MWRKKHLGCVVQQFKAIKTRSFLAHLVKISQGCSSISSHTDLWHVGRVFCTDRQIEAGHYSRTGLRRASRSSSTKQNTQLVLPCWKQICLGDMPYSMVVHPSSHITSITTTNTTTTTTTTTTPPPPPLSLLVHYHCNHHLKV